MLAFCGLPWWKKHEHPEEINSLGWEIPHANQNWNTDHEVLPLSYPGLHCLPRHFCLKTQNYRKNPKNSGHPKKLS